MRELLPLVVILSSFCNMARRRLLNYTLSVTVAVALLYGLYKYFKGSKQNRIRRTFEITKKWDGKTSSGHTTISLEHVGGTVVMSVTAPFYNDPKEPGGPKGQPFPQLWDSEVVEAFFLSESGKYLEVELCPHGQHLVLLLNGRRNIIKEQLPMDFESQITGNEWTGTAPIPLEYFPTKVSKFNLYAIHGSGEAREYEAYSPVPGDQPDFHRLEYFADLDFAAIVPENHQSLYSSSIWPQ